MFLCVSSVSWSFCVHWFARWDWGSITILKSYTTLYIKTTWRKKQFKSHQFQNAVVVYSAVLSCTHSHNLSLQKSKWCKPASWNHLWCCRHNILGRDSLSPRIYWTFINKECHLKVITGAQKRQASTPCCLTKRRNGLLFDNHEDGGIFADDHNLLGADDVFR